MTRAHRVAASCALAVAAFGVSLSASCTTFDGLTVPTPDATVSDAPRPADASADRGADGDGAPPPLTYLSMADAARACSLIFRCPNLATSIIQSVSVPVDSLNFSACMDWLAGPLPNDRIGIALQSADFACVAAASSCLNAGACLALEQFGADDPRCPDAGADAASERCIDDAGTVLRCADQYALHCGSSYYEPGSKCTVGDDKSHWCATGTSCTVTTSCIGALLDYCGAGSNLKEGINCASEGYACGIDPEAGAPDCLTDTVDVPCSAPGTDCAADLVTVCDGAEISHFDCAALGGTCSKAGGSAHCVRPSDTCSAFDASVDVCTGSSIALCVGGQKTSFDCASVGLSCKPASGAESGYCG